MSDEYLLEIEAKDRTFTHKALVRRVASWMKWTKNLPVVVSELSTRENEAPDVLGFHGPGGSMLVECKISRSDFLADKKKYFRKNEEHGMGDIRYFATPAGLLKVEDIPEGWGLLEVTTRHVREVVKPVPKVASKRAEVSFLCSVLRRLEISTAVFVRQDVSELADMKIERV